MRVCRWAGGVQTPRWRQWGRVVAAGALLLLVVVAGCQSSGDQPAPPSTARSATTTSDPLVAARAAVVATYRAWWDDILAANRDPAGASGRLEDHMSGDALKALRVFISDRRAQGLVGRGTTKIGPPTILRVTASQATVQGCVDATRFVDYRAGRLVPDSAGHVRSYQARLTNVRGRWMVAGFSAKESRCVA